MIPGRSYRSGRARKPKSPSIPSEAHVRHWRKLSAKARAVAEAPLSDAVGFVQAAEKAGGCVAPLGHRGEDSAFMKLVRLGKRFLLLSGVQRQEEAEQIGLWADAIDQTLDTMGQPVGRPYAED